MKSAALFALALLFLFAAQAQATPAVVAYQYTECLANPHIRTINTTGNGTWFPEITLNNSGSPIRYAVVKYSPISSKALLVTQSDDGFLDAYVCPAGSNCSLPSSWVYSSNIGKVAYNFNAGNQRRFNIAFEHTSGDALVVYGVWNTNAANDLGYKVLPAATSSFDGISEQYINDNGSAADLNYTWVRMDANPAAGSDEIIMAGFDSTGADLVGYIWTGSAWGGAKDISTTASFTTTEGFDVKYAADGSKGMVVSGDGTVGAMNYTYVVGGNWAIPPSNISAAAVLKNYSDLCPASNDVLWAKMDADPTTDDIMLLYGCSAAELNASYWNGTHWNMSHTLDNGLDASATRVFDFVWNASGSEGVLIWDTDTTSNTLSVKNYSTNASGWSTTGTRAFGLTTGAWMQLYRNPNFSESVEVFGLRHNAVNFDIGAFFRGANRNISQYSDVQLTNQTYVTTYEDYSAAFQNGSLGITAYRSYSCPETTDPNSVNRFASWKPNVRFWDNTGTTSWSREVDLPNSGNYVMYTRVKYSPLNQKLLLVTQSEGGFLDAYVCNYDCMNNNSWILSPNIAQVFYNLTAGTQRRYDIAFETATGDAVVFYSVYNNAATCDIAYKVLPANETTFNSAQEICVNDNSTAASDVNYTWIEARRNPAAGSQEILVAGFDATGSDIVGFIWNGTSLNNSKDVSTAASSTTAEPFAVAYAADGSKGMIVAGYSTVGNVNYTYVASGNWAIPPANAGDWCPASGDLAWAQMDADPMTDDIMLSFTCTASELNTSYWDGSTWATPSHKDQGIDSVTARPFDFAWNSTASTGMMFYDTDTTSATLNSTNWSGGAWGNRGSHSQAGQGPYYATTGAWLSVVANPNVSNGTHDHVQYLGLRQNLNLQVGSFYWNGTAFYNYNDTIISQYTGINTYENAFLNFLMINDTAGPTVFGLTVNATSVPPGGWICINASTVDSGGINVTLATVTYPNGTILNFTMSDTTANGCDAGSAGDNLFSVLIPAGATSGVITVNNTYANDTFNNAGFQPLEPRLNITVASAGLACGALSGADTTYTMTESITHGGGEGTCFTVTAAGVTLDCAGFLLNGANDTDAYGVFTDQAGTVVKNCVINSFNSAIYYQRATNGTLYNNTLYSNTKFGIFLNSTNSTNLLNNTVATDAWAGIFLEAGMNNSINTTNAKNSLGTAIRLDATYNSSVSDTQAYNSLDTGIILNSTINITVDNASSYGNAQYGLRLVSSDYNLLSNSTSYNNTQHGLYIITSASDYNVFQNLTLRDNGGYGLYDSQGSYNNFSYTYAANNSGGGIYIVRSTGNFLNQTALQLNWKTGIETSHPISTGNNFSGIFINTTGTSHGVYINGGTGNTVDCASGYINGTGNGTICLQDQANQTSCGAPMGGQYTCEGNWAAVQTCYLAADGDWSTFGDIGLSLGDGFMYVNYSKPSAASVQSKWQVRYAAVSETNYSISASCWAQTPLQLRLGTLMNGSVQGYCYDGGAWEILFTVADGSTRVFEEAMHWDLQPIGIYSALQNTTALGCNISSFAYGIQYSLANGTIANHMLHDNWMDGMALNSSNTNTVSNISAYLNNLSGIRASSSFDNTFTGISSYSNAGTGVLLVSSTYSSLSNITAYKNTEYGIYFSSSDYNNLTSSLAYNNSEGIRLLDSDYCIVSSSTVRDNGNYGFRLQSNQYNNYTNSTAYNNTVAGFYLYRTLTVSNDFNSVRDSRSYNNSGNGFLMTSNANALNFTNNTAYDNRLTGFNITLMENAIIANSTSYGNLEAGAYLQLLNSNFTGNNISANYSNLAAINLSGTTVGIFANNTLNATSFALYVIGSSATNNFTNNTLLSAAGTLLFLDSTSNGNTFWWNNFSATSGPAVNDSNDPTTPNYYNTSNVTVGIGNVWADVINGSVQVLGTYPAIIPGFYYGSQGSGYPYNNSTALPGRLYGYVTDYGPITSTFATSCQNFTAATNYTLGNNVSSSNGNCFNIWATNVTIDCRGFWITGNNATNTTGVFSNFNGTTVKNCNITGYSYGVQFYTNNVSNIINVTAISNTLHGFYLNNSSYNNLSQVWARYNAGAGLAILSADGTTAHGSAFNNVTGIEVNTTGAYHGIYTDSLYNSLNCLGRNITGAGNGTYCLQDTASIGSECNGIGLGAYACEDSWDDGGGFPCTNTYDGDWATYGTRDPLAAPGFSTIYMNYTVPLSALSSSNWQVQAGAAAPTNYSFSGPTSGCWGMNPLQLRIMSSTDNNTAFADCWDYSAGTGSVAWIPVFSEGSGNQVYEEAIYWEVQPFGIYATGSYTGVKNCVVSPFYHGIYYSAASYSNITNSSAHDNWDYTASNNIIVVSSASNNLYNVSGIANTSSASAGGSNGILIVVSDNANLTNVTGTSGISSGISISTSSGVNMSQSIGISYSGYGIVTSASPNFIMNNSTGESTTSGGISIASDPCSINMSTGTSATGYGMSIGSPCNISHSVGNSTSLDGWVITGSFVNLSHSYGFATSGKAFQLSSASNIVFNNVTANASTGIGIYASSVTSSRFENGTIDAAITGGVQAFSMVSSSNNNIIYNNTIITMSGYGVDINAGTDNSIVANNITAQTIGVRLVAANSNNISSNNFTRSTAQGVYIFRSNFNQLINNTINASGGGSSTAILVEYSNRTNITGNMVNTSRVGISIINSSNASLSLNTVNATRYPVYFLNSQQGIIANNTMNSTGGNTSLFLDVLSSNTSVYNNTLASPNYTLLFVSNNSSNNTFWWNNFTNTTGLYVNDTNGSNYYNTSNVTAGTGNIWYEVANGSVAVQGAYPAPFPSGFASAFYYGSQGSGYPYNNTTSYGKLAGGVYDYGPITPTLASTCRNLTENYTLTSNVTSTGGTCFPVTANNITLFCNGYSITGPNASDSIAFFSNYNHSLIRDCYITNFAEALRYNNGVGNTAFNNTLIVTFSGGNATHVMNGSNSTNLTSNGMLAGLANGAYIETGSQYALLDCLAGYYNASVDTSINGSNYSGTYGIYLSAPNATIRNCNLRESGRAIYLSNADGAVIWNVNATTTFTGDYALLLDTVTDNANISGSRFVAAYGASGLGAVRLIGGTGNNITNNTMNSTNGYTLVIGSGAANNNISNNSIYAWTTTAGSAFYWANTQGGNFTDNYLWSRSGALYTDGATAGRQFTANRVYCNQNGGTGVPANYCLYLQSTGSLNFTNNSFTGGVTGGANVVWIFGGSNMNFAGNSIHSQATVPTLNLQTATNIVFDSNNVTSSFAGYNFNYLINGASNNVFKNNQIGAVYYIGTASSNNLFANNTILYNSTVLATVITVLGTGNNFTNNTIISGTGALPLVYLTAASGNNNFYWNNFTNTSGYYVNDTNGSNFYNTTNGTAGAGVGIGNVWFNVINGSIEEVGANQKPAPFPPGGASAFYYGDSGTGYPYNNTTSTQGTLQKLYGNVVDYGPITSDNSTGLSCGIISSSGTYAMNANLSSPGATCFNITAANVLLNCTGYAISGDNTTGTYGVVTSAYNTSIINCSISSFDYGIYYANASYNGTAQYNNVYSNAGIGIRFVNSSNNTLASNSFCSNPMDLDNAGLDNGGSLGSLNSCDSFLNYTENGHSGCTFACTSLWHRFFGNVTGTIFLGTSNISPYVYSWTGATGLNVFMADYDSTIDWQNLQAIGKTAAGAASSDDFLELDTAFSSSAFRDNISNTYSDSGSGAKFNDTYTVYSASITEVPVFNSSLYDTAFKTGILWDKSAGGEYSGTQSTVWIAKVNTTQADVYGNYQYLVSIPYTLSTYEAGNDLIAIYAELQ